jgi:two-component system response regulator NreC
MRAIQEAAKGHYYLSHPLSSRIIEDYRQRVSTSAMQDPYETLTYRERDILHLIVEGYSYTEIARRLSISHRTVETHRKNLMRKLGLRTTTMLILYALRRGILPPQCPENQSQSLSAG